MEAETDDHCRERSAQLDRELRPGARVAMAKLALWLASEGYAFAAGQLYVIDGWLTAMPLRSASPINFDMRTT